MHEFTVRRDIVDAITAHAMAALPAMACGVVAGRCGRPDRFVPMVNAEGSATYWSLDGAEQLQVWKEMERRDEEPVIIYHSDPAGIGYPSRLTIGFAAEPRAHYVIVAVDRYEVAFRSFRIETGEVTEEAVNVVASY